MLIDNPFNYRTIKNPSIFTLQKNQKKQGTYQQSIDNLAFLKSRFQNLRSLREYTHRKSTNQLQFYKFKGCKIFTKDALCRKDTLFIEY